MGKHHYRLTDAQLLDAQRHYQTMILPGAQIEALRRRAIGTSMAAQVCRWRLVDAFTFLVLDAFETVRWRGDEILSVSFLILAHAVHGRPQEVNAREIKPIAAALTNLRGFERCLIRRLQCCRRRWEREELAELKAMPGKFRQTRMEQVADYVSDLPTGSARMDAIAEAAAERRLWSLDMAVLLEELPELRSILTKVDDIEFVDALLTVARGGKVAETKLAHWADCCIREKWTRLRALIRSS